MGENDEDIVESDKTLHASPYGRQDYYNSWPVMRNYIDPKLIIRKLISPYGLTGYHGYGGYGHGYGGYGHGGYGHGHGHGGYGHGSGGYGHGSGGYGHESGGYGHSYGHPSGHYGPPTGYPDAAHWQGGHQGHAQAESKSSSE